MINSTDEPAIRRANAYTLGLFALMISMLSIGCAGISENEAQHREMVAAGKASFRAYCAGCHGPEGKGDGPAVEYMSAPVADLTQIGVRYGDFPDDAIFKRIDGYNLPADSTIQMMPSWGNIWRGMNTEWETPQDVRDRINQIVSYLKTIQQPSS